MEIKNFKLIDKGCLKASFTFVMEIFDKMGNREGVQRADCNYFEKGDSYWINACSKMYEARDGTKKSYQMLGWDDALTKKITRVVHEKIKNKEYAVAVPKQPQAQTIDDLPF